MSIITVKKEKILARMDAVASISIVEKEVKKSVFFFGMKIYSYIEIKDTTDSGLVI